ncbi:activated protein kinase catalytic subunit alpha-1 [Seminavis robusta]|uniref:Guanylate cyclase n=1 Tax=Seminavis robusta TaxID=568900 RepID=A0A9N8F140_9STRA|nr:activated protein kinase catalytic subunit alpha-1 [Seminavis robusta]|eukprot:Sro2297_g322400.1 activated protein kinase catalytic subunit alpha-1 (1181) ;mRNA; f:441-4924
MIVPKHLSLMMMLVLLGRGVYPVRGAGTTSSTEGQTTTQRNNEPGLVSMRRSIDTSIVSSDGCTFDGTVVFGGPSSLEQDDKYYFMAHRQLLAYQLMIDTINRERCGIRVGGKHYKIDLQTYDDQSDADITTAIGHKLVQAPYSNNNSSSSNSAEAIDLIVSGFSSFLTKALANVVAEHNINATTTASQASNSNNPRLMLAGGSSLTSIFQNRSNIFTTTPPSANFLRPAMQGLSLETTAKTVATLWENVGFPISACKAVPELAHEFSMELISETQVEADPNVTLLTPLAAKLKELNPDVVIGCMYECERWMAALRAVHWSPKAQVFTICVGSDKFVEAVGTDAAYVMGVAPWHESVRATDALTGWTSQEFTQHYSTLSSESTVVYQATTAAAMISIAVQTMEAIQSYSDAPLLADYMSRHTFPTMFGDISFDENGQNAAPMLLLQYDSIGAVQTAFPVERSSGQILYPMPTWDGRDCVQTSSCVQVYGYTCSVEGYCICPEGKVSTGVGIAATCVVAASRSSSAAWSSPGAIFGIVAALFAVLGIMAWFFVESKQKKADSVWRVSKSELQFAEPPKVVGRGSFGVVLLGSYRGTDVAVKRVIPPRESNDNNNDCNGKDKEWEHESEFLEEPKGNDRAGSTSWGVLSLGLKTNDTGMFAGGLDDIESSDGPGSDNRRESGRGSVKSVRRKLQRDFVVEMRYLSKLRHPCITTVMGAVLCPGEEPLLIMEYMDHGSLHDILHNNTMILDGEILLPILRDISSGMRFLHATNLLHKDLKPANVLIARNFHAKLADFGLSKGKLAVGSPYFMAPELLRGDSVNTSASDVYAFGITLYEVFSRKDPYEGENPKEVLKLVADPSVGKRPPVPMDCPAQIVGLMSDCLVEDPQERPSFEEVDMRLKRMDIAKVETRRKSKRRSVTGTISLFDIFPEHIALALKDGKKVDSEHKDCVTIFFSDIVGFTTLSSQMEPRKVANLLDRLYTKFDQLSHYEDIFKVETIGDAYMAVTNLVKDQDDHAARIARFSAAAIAAANDTLIDTENPALGCVNIRVGLHSGPVVADVVGTRNPRYCLFGDTVNTASRMESTSEANSIHCSKASADLLVTQDKSIEVRSRGLTEIKGKGEMESFWVIPNGTNSTAHAVAAAKGGDKQELAEEGLIPEEELIPEQRPFCERVGETFQNE